MNPGTCKIPPKFILALLFNNNFINNYLGKGIKMSTHKKIKTTVITIAVIVFFALIIAIPFIIQDHNSIKIGSISSKNIKSFVINDVAGRPKDISNNAEREKIINLINSVNITERNVTPRCGGGYSIEIVYSNGQKFNAHFLSSTVSYCTDNSTATWCKIDKNIVDDLRKYYDEN